jgi:hypothetical protein
MLLRGGCELPLRRVTHSFGESLRVFCGGSDTLKRYLRIY